MTKRSETLCLLMAPRAQAGHFAGLPEALEGLCAKWLLECSQEHAPVRLPQWLLDDGGVVLHAEPSPGRAAGVVIAARRSGCPCALLMDGICDFGNTFLHPEEPSLLRPPPGDVVLAAGRHDRAVLRALGARAVATGLPRLEMVARELAIPKPIEKRDAVIIATATRPCLTPGARPRLIAALQETRDACDVLGVRAVWRLPSDLADELGVEPDIEPLASVLRRSCAVISTASTLVIEAMLAGLPVGVLHPHPWPLWLPAAWRWMNDGGVGSETDLARARRIGPIAEAATSSAFASSRAAFKGSGPSPYSDIAGLLSALLRPADDVFRAQRQVLRRLASPRAAHRVARTLLALSSQHPKIPARPPRRLAASNDLQVVSLIEAHGSSVGGVSVWSERLERWFTEHPDEGIEWRTLFVSPCDPPPTERMSERPCAETVLLDPTAPDVERLNCIADRLGGADVVIPNYGWLAHAAAQVASAEGARVLSIAHTDDEVSRDIIRRFPPTSAGVGVNRRIAKWLSAHGVPAVETILYGVPEHPPCERRSNERPLEIVSIGRVVERQKRIGDIIRVLAALEHREVDFRFHLIGDGPDLQSWLHAAADARIHPDRLMIHGALPPAHVQTMLRSFDVFVLASEAEGTSVAALEAMAAGVVPVVTATPGMTDLLTHGKDGMLCPIGDPAAMANAIEALWTDADRLLETARRAQATIARQGLTVERCAMRYAEIIRRLRTTSAPHRALDPAAALRPESVWRARGASIAPELEALADRLSFNEPVVSANATCPGSGALIEPGLDDDPRAHLTHTFELARRAGPVAVAATGTRSMPALEWLARFRRNDLAAFLVPGVAPGTTLFGIQARPFGHTPLETGVVLVPHPAIDRTGLLAAVAHGLHRSFDLRFPEHQQGEIVRAESLLAEREETRTTFPPGVLPNATSMRPADLVRSLGRQRAEKNLTVVLRGDENDFSVAAAIEKWIERGGDLRSPSWRLTELTSPARCARLIGERTYAFYGAGAHTRRLLRHMPVGTPRPKVIYDDQAEHRVELEGIPVVRPQSAPLAPGDLVVLSSVAFERELWDCTAPWRSQGVEVLRLYEPDASSTVVRRCGECSSPAY